MPHTRFGTTIPKHHDSFSSGIGIIPLRLLERLSGIHARRPQYASHPDHVWDILREGSKRARAVAAGTLAEVRSAMKIDYQRPPT